MSNDLADAENGFTLLEVLVALTVLGISLPVIFGVLSDSLTRIRDNEAQSLAGAHAQSLLTIAGATQPLADGATSGELPDGFRWHLQVTPYGDAADAEAWTVKARRVTATITWRAGDAERSVRLTTLRLLPREPSP